MMNAPGLSGFISLLDKSGELLRVKPFVDPVLEITEITDRITKSGGKALLFENTGTPFPLLINAFASDHRFAMAIGHESLDDVGQELELLLRKLTGPKGSLFQKLSAVPSLLQLSSIMPKLKKTRGICQQVIHSNPDLSILPVLKCWPYDGGRFITLPIVHTINPVTGDRNAGMYRMQVIDSNTTAMHWQRHKTGSNHYEAWKKSGKRMPVSVALGGDPVYTYCATAPLPENVDEYILAGFLRREKVQLVKCITNDLYVPDDADIIIEGYVDPAEELFCEGPFGDHTGFYSLADYYPKFHVTCITHSRNAVYPATIVGIPPQEDAWLIKANEKIFLTPMKLALSPEIIDFHMPDAGVAHNLVIVKIRKTYPGQGMKVINSLLGAGQMMFTKYIVVVSGDVDIRNYEELIRHVAGNTCLSKDISFLRGPLDVLDHSSDTFSFGGKAGLDATIKLPEEIAGSRAENIPDTNAAEIAGFFRERSGSFNLIQAGMGIPVLIVPVDSFVDRDATGKLKQFLKDQNAGKYFRLVLAVDSKVDPEDHLIVAWQVLSNSDPVRDHDFISAECLFIDATIKAFSKAGFPRKWPNIVCSSDETILGIDRKWQSLGLGDFIESPSNRYKKLLNEGKDYIKKYNY
jgi:4-hydroxy-3-polyprenylbenzoate decarboxylase